MENEEQKMLGIYFDAAGTIIKNSKYDEASSDGLLLQVALLKKIKEVIDSSIKRLEGNLENIVLAEQNPN